MRPKNDDKQHRQLKKKILFLTPPFTQLNTPYPATAYLKGFTNTLGYPAVQADLGIEVILALFTAKTLRRVFKQAERQEELSDNAWRIIALADDYVATIGPVIAFLQGKNPTLAHSICTRSYLPEASRFEGLDDMDWPLVVWASMTERAIWRPSTSKIWAT
ncbi:MAG: hypothetical protein R2795_12725 [Saprospiraceae bacterium]